MNWTKELPAVSGFYWYREASEPMVVWWNTYDKSADRCGCDSPLFSDIDEARMRLDGEFWPARIQPPPVEGSGPCA